MATSSTKVITGLVRGSYMSVLEAKPDDNGKLKYKSMFIFPKSDKATKKAIDDAVQAAFDAGKDKLGVKSSTIPNRGFNTPLHDGDEERPDDPACANSWYLNASSDSKPGIVDTKLKPIMDPDEIYSGAWFRVSLNFYAYNVKNKGIAAGLNNLMKVKDDERLDGKASAENDFGDLSEWEDNEDDDLL